MNGGLDTLPMIVADPRDCPKQLLSITSVINQTGAGQSGVIQV